MALRIVMIRSNQVCPDSRVEKEASALVENEQNVTVVAWDRRSDHKATKEILTAFDQEIPIVRLGHKAEFGQGFRSLKPYLGFQWNLFWWLIRNRKDYDVIHACDFDTAFTSTIANIFLGKRYIFDIFDYIGGERKTLLQKTLCRLQNWIINRASATIICTEDRRRQIAAAKPRKLAVIHNSPPKITSEAEVKQDCNGKIKICYVGILQDYRLLKEIPEFFVRHPEYELHIGGFGKYEEYYRELAMKHSNIIFYGRLQYSDTLRLERNCDVMLAIYDPSIENHVFAAPNKFYEGLMIGKPLVMVRGTGMSDIVDKYKIGETIEYSIGGFERGLLRLAERRNEWPDISERMLKVYDEFSWDEMKSRLCRLYDEIDA